MLLATSLNLCTGRFPETHLMPRLRAAGYDGLDFNFIDLIDRLDWSKARAVNRFLGDLERAADKAGLTWVQAHGPMFHLFGKTPKDDKCRSLCAPCLRLCARLGVPWMVLHPDVWAGPFDRAHRRAILDANVAFFRGLLPACEKHGVGIAIENIFDPSARAAPRCAGRHIATPEELCELIDALDHPLIGACWDTGHARIMQLEQRGAIASLGARLKVVHIQENDGKDDDHMLPFSNGRAGVDWKAVADGLRLAGFKGAFTYEVHNAFRALPEELFDATLRHSVVIARRIIAMIESPA